MGLSTCRSAEGAPEVHGEMTLKGRPVKLKLKYDFCLLWAELQSFMTITAQHPTIKPHEGNPTDQPKA